MNHADKIHVTTCNVSYVTNDAKKNEKHGFREVARTTEENMMRMR